MVWTTSAWVKGSYCQILSLVLLGIAGGNLQEAIAQVPPTETNQDRLIQPDRDLPEPLPPADPT
ncbi:MAG: hypothetical protein SAJ12_24240, partial [Jaaginema sp. PMC 1079.18]|nr:hypothetical protein [Jaaginema sp. PMC 1079.18]